MTKKVKILFLTLLLALVMTIPVSMAVKVDAATGTSANRTLKANTWTKVTGSPWLKIVVKKNGYITITNKSEFKAFYAVLYNSKKKQCYDTCDCAWTDIGKNIYWAVKKGTYYLKPFNAEVVNPDSDPDIARKANVNDTIKYTFSTVSSKQTMIKKSKSKAVKANKSMKILNFTSTSPAKWTRWYKIKLTKSKRLYLTYHSVFGKFEVLTSKGKAVSMEAYKYKENYNVNVSLGQLKKGTYYIRFKEIYWDKLTRKENLGDLSWFKWN